jgi:hypothetical protein
MVNAKENNMNYAAWLELDGNLQVDVMERVLNRIMCIPAINRKYDSDFEEEFIGSNQQELLVIMTCDVAGIAESNAQALRDYLTANNVKFEYEQKRVVIFSVQDLFTLFSDE